MGRPLKTKKYQQDTNTTVDSGFPNNGQSNNGYNLDNPGIVGGYSGPIRVTVNMNIPGAGTLEASTTSATVTGTGTQFQYNGIQAGSVIYANGVELGTVDAIANATSLTLTANSAANASGIAYSFDSGVNNGYILRQKGKSKFMVVLDRNVEDEGIATGGQYFITNANDTNWNALGAGPDAGYGKVFTAKADGVNLSTNGQVSPVSVCTLVASGSLNAGEMSMEVYNDGDTNLATAITNHWVSSDADTSTKYIATIFNSNGNVDPATGYTIVGVENWC